METWEEVISGLERATARLVCIPADDFLEVAEAMNERSVAVAHLREFAEQPPEPISGGFVDRLKEDWKRGAAINQKLLLMRAAVRLEFSRAAEAGFMARSLSPGPTSAGSTLDVVG
ncbi:MAG: hypothetical protein KIT09_31440 [Bryobacteraceae bacterium]|nr:hypothetical protein [Bryobacteraceae bacterium]